MFTLKNQSLTLNDVVTVARHLKKVKLSPTIKQRVNQSRQAIETAVKNSQVVYGVTTGFGAFKNTVIDIKQTKKLQKNLILSHAVGVGDFLPQEVVRGIILLMANYLSKGYSGVKLNTINALIGLLNRGVVPLVPSQGSVGSSGDLAPSAHVILVLLGLGEAQYQGKHMSGKRALSKAGLKSIELDSKEGLALINNTCTMTSISALLVYDTHQLLLLADLIACLSLQGLAGTDKAFADKIHQLKPHPGQIETAKNLRHFLKGSSFINKDRIQEAYSFRCLPQIHGGIREALRYTQSVVTTEINSVTDNPLIFPDESSLALSGGNFHGEPIAIAMDTLGIALSEVGNVSDRRLATLVDPATNNGLPAFLAPKGGLNSGYMIPQYTTAALVSENKILSHPASVDSIPTSANTEDLVSMGTIAARKARTIYENTANVLTIELIGACQAIDLRKKLSNPNLHLSPTTQKAYNLVRQHVPYFKKDTTYYQYFRQIRSLFPQIFQLIG